MPQHCNNLSVSREPQIQLALQALKRDANLSNRRAAALYNVPESTLRSRRAGVQYRRDWKPKSMRLKPTEEEVIVQMVLDLDARGFSPRITDVKAMADALLAERGQHPIGKNWTSMFIQRRDELRTKFFRCYDYQRAKCEDPVVIRDWFRLVENTKAKYGVTDEDTYNFDESGFMMGMIRRGVCVTSADRRGDAKKLQQGNREWVSVIQGVNAVGWAIPPFIIFAGKNHLSSWYQEEKLPHDWKLAVSENGWTNNELTLNWLKHFDEHTVRRTVGTVRLLILDGHESHHSIAFERYCKDHKIVTLCMPSHSSHLLQPLDVGCFAPLKKAYGRQAEVLMRNHINHITKTEFLPCFIAAFKASFSKSNIQGGFQGAGLVPFDPEAVISKLDIRLRTPTPSCVEETPWVSKTPSNTREIGSQSTLLRERIQKHVNSSPTSMMEALERFTKGAEMMAHSMVLMQKRNLELQAANEAAARRKSRKRKRLQRQGTLTVEEGQRLNLLREVEGSNKRKKGGDREEADEGTKGKRHCKTCGETGHNSRTCKNDVENCSD
jgi:hypothetical protein